MLLGPLLGLLAAASSTVAISHSGHSRLTTKYLSKRTTYPNPGTVTGATTGVHDPSMVKTPGGAYILYGTGTGIPTGLQRIARNGSPPARPFRPLPPQPTRTQVSRMEASGLRMSLTWTGRLENSWTNEGLVTSTASGDSYNAIDPHLIVVGSGWYLSLGSFWTGIKLIDLSASTGKPSGTTVTSISERTADSGAEEGSWIYYSSPYYYLFTSWDKCCDGTSGTHNIRVSRSKNLAGPYVDKSGVAALSGGGTEILGTHGTIYGPGGQSILTDTDGAVLVYHYYSATTSILGINLLNFTSGWPVVY